jgi:HTH-type transcriptional regulator/antitoxin HigA
MATSKIAMARAAAEDSYLALVRRFPLRLIRTKAQHQQALMVIDELMSKGERRDTGESEYLETLARLLADYERETLERVAAKTDPVDVLRLLMDARKTRRIDLGKLIGKSTATMVLKGDRELSKSHIRTLADYFGVSPALFI